MIYKIISLITFFILSLSNLFFIYLKYWMYYFLVFCRSFFSACAQFIILYLFLLFFPRLHIICPPFYHGYHIITFSVRSFEELSVERTSARKILLTEKWVWSFRLIYLRSNAFNKKNCENENWRAIFLL